MDWQVRPSSRESQLSGATFAPGSRVRSVLWRDGAGEWQRLDGLESEPMTPPPGPVAGWWVREIRSGKDPEAERRRLWQASAEELFLNFGDEAAEEEAAAVRYLLALQLERKRRLRPVGRSRNGIQEYRHPRSGRHFRVPVINLGPAEWGRLTSALERVLG